MSDEKHSTITTSTHRMVVAGSVFTEYKKLIVTHSSGGLLETSTLNHIRSIDNQSYSVNQEEKPDQPTEETISTDLSSEELDEFKLRWNNEWKPLIAED